MSAAFPLREAYRSGNLAKFDVIMQVANWEHTKGGPWESVRLGKYEDIRDARENRLLMEMFLAGVIAIMMIYHVGLFISNREDKSTLYFAVMALMLLLRTTITSERVLHMLLPGMNWTLALKIEYVTGFCSTAFIVLFMDYLFREHIPRKVNMAVIGAGALIFLIVAATPPWLFTGIKNAFQIYLVAAGLYAVGVLAVLSFRRVRGAFVAFLGFTLLFFSGINDILYSDLVINTMYLAPVGLFFFILSQSYLLSSEYSQSLKSTRREAEKNRAQNVVISSQNDFIKNVLSEASSSILSSASRISSAIEVFRDNERDQAAHTEEVASALEEITDGSSLIARSTEGQNEDLMRLDDSIRELAAIINDTGREVSQALEAVGKISSDARTGNESMETMSGSISNIFESTAQVNGIIQIINDISDRINLLSLNAAIEAARAGESGRGFAVVADEISKLADQTASSIKEIDRLIKTNEEEIRAGAGNITRAVEAVSAIISNIEIINTRISAISDLMRRQLELNASITGGAGTVRESSDLIKKAMGEQKNGIEEISATIGVISEITQKNARSIEEISDAAHALLEMVNRFNKDIEEYEGAAMDGAGE